MKWKFKTSSLYICALMFLMSLFFVMTFFLDDVYASDFIVNDVNNETNLVMNDRKVLVELDKNEMYADLYLHDDIIYGGFAKIAVWSEKQGQDDIVWYFVNNPEKDVYVRVPIQNHKSDGLYYVHAYYSDIQGIEYFYGSAEFQIHAISPAGISVINKDKDTLSFDISIDDFASVSGVGIVKLAVWTKNGGQDDIKWTYQSSVYYKDGKYHTVIKSSVKDHYYENGLYYIHVYLTARNGVEGFLGEICEDIQLSSFELSSNLSEDEMNAVVLINSNIFNNGFVKVAVWSAKSGQSSVRWYLSNIVSAPVSISVPLSDHCLSGLYYVHAYYCDMSGGEAFCGNTDFRVEGITGGTISVTDKDPDDLSFRSNVKEFKSKCDVSQVKFAIWTENKGQDDIKWMNGTIIQNAVKTYSSSVVVPISEHFYENGIYNIHIYAKSNNGVECFLGSIREDIQLLSQDFNAVLNESQTISSLSIINNVIASDGQLKFAVWSKKSQQSDIRWYIGEKAGPIATKSVYISDFKKIDLYVVHAYFISIDSQEYFLGETTFEVKPIQAALSVSDISSNLGTFSLNVNNVKPDIGISRVTVPTWNIQDGPAAAHWYDCCHVREGTYSVDATAAFHSFYSGVYISHLYIMMENGCECFIGEISYTVELHNAIFVNYAGASLYDITLSGTNPNAFAVKFPTWSDAGGQDDIQWYQAARVSSTIWTFRYSARCHWPAGLFNTHSYLFYSDGHEEKGGEIVYDVPEEAVAKRITPLHNNYTGVDVSEYQQGIDWALAAATGQIGFAMIRLGYGVDRADYQFYNNYNNAVTYGFPVGGYWYSYARSVDEARAEGYKCLEILGGRIMDLPIAFDLEQYPDIDPVTNALMTNEFCKVLDNAGVQTMLYASEFWLNNKISMVNVTPSIYTWAAKWSSYSPIVPCPERVKMWQYTSDGRVPGIIGRVDMNRLIY